MVVSAILTAIYIFGVALTAQHFERGTQYGEDSPARRWAGTLLAVSWPLSWTLRLILARLAGDIVFAASLSAFFIDVAKVLLAGAIAAFAGGIMLAAIQAVALLINSMGPQ